MIDPPEGSKTTVHWHSNSKRTLIPIRGGRNCQGLAVSPLADIMREQARNYAPRSNSGGDEAPPSRTCRQVSAGPLGASLMHESG